MPGLAGIRGQQTSDELIRGSEKVMNSPFNVSLLSQDSRLIINCLEVQTSWSKVPFRNLAAISEKQGSGQSAKGSEKLVLRSNCYWCSFLGNISRGEVQAALSVITWRTHHMLRLQLLPLWFFGELIRYFDSSWF